MEQFIRNLRFIGAALVMCIVASATVPAGAAVIVAQNVDHLLDRQVTGNNDGVKCKHQPCSPDGKFQATGLDLKIGPSPAGTHLANVKLTSSDNQPFPQFCLPNPDLHIGVREASAYQKCWSAAVTWTLSGDVVPDSP